MTVSHSYVLIGITSFAEAEITLSALVERGRVIFCFSFGLDLMVWESVRPWLEDPGDLKYGIPSFRVCFRCDSLRVR